MSQKAKSKLKNFVTNLAYQRWDAGRQRQGASCVAGTLKVATVSYVLASIEGSEF